MRGEGGNFQVKLNTDMFLFPFLLVFCWASGRGSFEAGRRLLVRPVVPVFRPQFCLRNVGRRQHTRVSLPGGIPAVHHARIHFANQPLHPRLVTTIFFFFFFRINENFIENKRIHWCPTRTSRALVKIRCAHRHRTGCWHVRLHGVDLPRLETLQPCAFRPGTSPRLRQRSLGSADQRKYHHEPHSHRSYSLFPSSFNEGLRNTSLFLFYFLKKNTLPFPACVCVYRVIAERRLLIYDLNFILQMESIRHGPTITDRYPSPIPRQLHPQVRDLIYLMGRGVVKTKEQTQKQKEEKGRHIAFNIGSNDNARLATAASTAWSFLCYRVRSKNKQKLNNRWCWWNVCLRSTSTPNVLFCLFLPPTPPLSSLLSFSVLRFIKRYKKKKTSECLST